MRSDVSLGCTAASVVTEPLSATATVQNQLSGIGMTYDAAGNVTNDGNGNMPTYDDENRITAIAGYTYSYDADGMRMEKTTGSSGTMYWFGPGGEVLTETDLTGTVINEEYFFFNGQRIARVDRPSGAVNYYFSDHLGSASVITGASGSSPTYYYYYPYGGLAATVGGDPNHYKFTGKERDSESNLDQFGARYYGSSLSRFMTIDPITGTPLHLINPQRWNMYAYVLNSPLVLTDPDGRDAAYVNFSGMAHGFGHGGVLSIHSDGSAKGSATYSRFGPASAGSAVGAGEVQTDHELPEIQFGSNGLPTAASLNALTQAVAQFENVDPSTVGINYFKTSETDTWLLDQYILQQQAASDAGNAPTYCVKGQNCTDYAVAGLVAGHALESWRVRFMPFTPNGIFNFFQGLADFSSGTSKAPDKPLKEKVTTKICADPACKNPL